MSEVAHVTPHENSTVQLLYLPYDSLYDHSFNKGM